MAPTQTELQQIYDQAVGLHKNGDLPGAEQLYLRVLAAAPATFVALLNLGIARAHLGRPQEALEAVAAALRVNPNAVEAWMHYGNILRALGRMAEALSAFDKAYALDPGYAEALYNSGTTLLDLGRPAEALTRLERVVDMRPDFVAAWANRGLALSALGRFEEALKSHDTALALKPDDPDFLNQRGAVLWGMNRRAEALAHFDRAIEYKPDFLDAWCNRANVLRHLGRVDDALAACERALAINPDFVPALDQRGIVLWEMERLEDALAAFDKAIALNPSYAPVRNSRAVVLRDMKRYDESVAECERALTLNPNYADAEYNRGNALQQLKRLEAALGSYERTLRLDPQNRFALSGVADVALTLCDWKRADKLRQQLPAAAGQAVITPLVLLGYGADAATQLLGTRTFLKDRVPVELPRLPAAGPAVRDKIRLAYLSADFIRHPVAYQIAELIERHDRSKFEVIGISFGPDDSSDIRARLKDGFDSFHDMQGKNGRAIAELVHSLGVDIAVDLSGHTHGSRVDIFAYRPAPVQVNYLGYPATIGADFIDYILGDRIVLPLDRQPFYSEKIVHLPDTFWVADSTRPIAAVPTRTDAGLPPHGFVFCAFNNHWKITAEIWGLWMRLLAAVPGSVLWLKHGSDGVRHTLAREAKTRGIDPERLIYAPPLDAHAEHLARHGVADLFLDTVPYNAHATASDALWAGLPLVTCMGETFPGRVAASLLHALGLPELVADNLRAYEALALDLTRDPSRLKSLREKLAANRNSKPLFDTERFRRNIEAAYVQMLAERSQTRPRPAN